MDRSPRPPEAFPKAAFPKAVRLRTAGDFTRVQKTGRSVDLGPLVFRVSKRDEGPGRLGLAISKKVGNSPQRNHVKRRVRECFRRRQGSFVGLDLVAIGRAGAAELAMADVERLFDELTRRLQPSPKR